MLQLNQSDSQATNAQTPVKHPKMTKKLLVKETIEPNVVVPTGPQQTFSDSIPVSKLEPPPYREVQIQDNEIPMEETVRPNRVQLQRRPDEQSITFEQFQQFQKQQQQLQQQMQQQQMQQQQMQEQPPQLPLAQVYRYPNDRRRPNKVYDMDQDAADDYESYLTLGNPNKDPLVTRSRFSVNRDVRSQSSDGSELHLGFQTLIYEN